MSREPREDAQDELIQRLDGLSRRVRELEATNEALRDELATLRDQQETREAVLERHAERLDRLDVRTDSFSSSSGRSTCGR